VDAAPAPPSARHPAPDPLEPWPADVAWRRVSSRLVLLELLHLGALVLAMLVAVVAVWALVSRPVAVVVAVVVLVGAAVRSVLVVRSVRSWGYAERAEDLLIRHGLMVRRLSIVPYARMQFVDVTAGPLERSLGLATVKLHTAAAASDATVPGLEGAEATRLRDRLATLGEARHEGL
jgi:membrane protein YdbS with pleckstrin-like domain